MRQHGIFGLTPFFRLGLFAVLCLLLQTASGQTAPESDSEADAAWQPPQLVDLPIDWWERFDSPSPSVLEQRLEAFTGAAAGAIAGLDGADLLTANTLLHTVRGHFDLLTAARQAPAPEPFAPIATRDLYTLDELLALRAQWRDLDKRQKVPRLRLEELASQAALLQRRMDALVPQYNGADRNAPERILLGLQRVAARVEYEVTNAQAQDLEARLQAIESQYRQLNEHLQFALSNLSLGTVDWAALDAAAAEAHEQVSALSEKLSDVQQQLLTVVSAADSTAGLELLRKQQLTRASAQLALARLREARLEALATWLRVRSGTLEFDFETRQAIEQRKSFVEETSRQADVWAAASRTTILSPPSGGDLTSLKNVELAQSAARETLALIDQIHDTTDDLGLLHEALTIVQVGMQQGLQSIWTRFTVSLGEAGRLLSGFLDITLFHIGDAPVTTGSILKMLVILALGLALSWFIRHLLERLKGRRQFAGSPAVYTLGRLLHYLIILVAVFAAFGSIGLDFRNFALIAGALSVGIGFGLQSIVNNFVSGLILLFEGSLRVGDYIELETGLRGIVKEINTRSTLIRTNDNIDMVVPNSHFMTTQLTNWTLREPMARFRIGFGVAYGSDKDEVKAAALEAASKVDLVVQHMPSRKPDVWLVDFGDNALLFELLVWVSQAGVRRPARVRAAVLWELETQLSRRGIEIPFPQRDLHLRSGFLPASPVEASEPD
jgi:small-conductance mechanosensitive channel